MTCINRLIHSQWITLCSQVQKQLKTYQILQLHWPVATPLNALGNSSDAHGTWYKKHRLQIIDPVWLFLSEFYLKNMGRYGAQLTVLYSPPKKHNCMQYYTYMLHHIKLQLYVEEARKLYTVSTNKLWPFM
jgi:hypothetical protein